MGIGVKCDGVDQRHINFSVHHDALIGGDIDHLADDAASIFVVLILDELALQANRELVDDRRIYGFGFTGGQTAAGKFFGCFDRMGGIGNADGKRTPRFKSRKNRFRNSFGVHPARNSAAAGEGDRGDKKILCLSA